MVTLEDLSLEVGCSVNTVSRALNNKPDVSKETKKRVLEAAKRLGYVPNTLAKSLVTKVSGTIGVVVPSIDNPLYAKIIESVERNVAAYNYSVILAQSSDASTIGIDPIETLYQRRVDGLLVVPSVHDLQGLEVINRYNIPTVCILHDLPGWDYSFVGIDEEDVAYCATQHLIQHGRRKILFMKSGATCDKGADGYRRAIADYDIHETYISTVDLNPASGYTCCKTIIQGGEHFDGIVLPHDILFPGVYTAISEYGLSCPRDVAVVGFGNIELCPYFQSPLTSMEIPLQFICVEALRLLIDSVRLEKSEGEAGLKQRVLKDAKLVIRKSCGARYL